jgi:CRISPR type I-D-associated protein Csc2
MRYQIVINRKLLGYGQFVTEGRDEVNTTVINGEERPFIFASKLRAVERRTIMNKVRKVLGNDCFLQVHEKAGESGISGLCMSCPACWLFGGTYAPGEKIQVNERTKVNYSDAYPFEKIPIEDKTFNAVDEKRNITGQALGVNQIIGPGGNFINVVDIDTENEDWVKLIVWGIEHSNRYGGNVRIYGQIKNEILGIIRSDRLEVSSWDLVNNFKNLEDIKKHLEKDYKNKLVKIDMTKENIDSIVTGLNKSEEVQKLKERKEQAEGKKSRRRK